MKLAPFKLIGINYDVIARSMAVKFDLFIQKFKFSF